MGSYLSRASPQEDAGEAAIDAFIDEILRDSATNMSCVPDTLERAMYRRTFRFLVSAAKKSLLSVSIRALNHEIVMDIRPLKPTNT